MLCGMAKRLGWYLPEQLTLKITLLGSEPKIWRRVEVHSGLTLHELHIAIQCVFAWDNSHLYHFLAPAGGKLTRRAMTEATRYHVLPPDPVFDDDETEDLPADQSMVGQVLNRERKQIVYEYDFGDSWEHLVKVEKRSPGGHQEHIPVCLAGENAAPVDDVGGLHGFYLLIAGLADETHDWHEDAMNRLGKDFDPARFDLELANQRLKEAFKPAPKKPRKPRKKSQ